MTAGDFVATTVVDASALAPGGSAGISAYGDEDNALGASVTAQRAVRLWRREKGKEQEIAVKPEAVASARPLLRMTTREGHLYRFAVSDDGLRWADVGGEIDGDYLPPWDRGVRVALVAGGVPAGAPARFGWLRITPSHRLR
jgi:hypothetical protein